MGRTLTKNCLRPACQSGMDTANLKRELERLLDRCYLEYRLLNQSPWTRLYWHWLSFRHRGELPPRVLNQIFVPVLVSRTVTVRACTFRSPFHTASATPTVVADVWRWRSPRNDYRLSQSRSGGGGTLV
jgi:hypothetical protein